jgi:hypothetical protein
MDAENRNLAWTTVAGGVVAGGETRSRSPSPAFGRDDEEEDEEEEEEDDDDDDVEREGSAPRVNRRSASVPRDRPSSRGRSGTPSAPRRLNDAAETDPWSLFGPPALHAAETSSAPVRRFVGHANVKTFLKGVAFACDDAYVATGGDCGGLFIWHKKTGTLVRKVQADAQVVNSVCPHPRLPVLVTSGIDDVVRIWEPGEGDHLLPLPNRDPEDSDDLAEEMLAELERGGHFAEVWDRLARSRSDGDDAEDGEDEGTRGADDDADSSSTSTSSSTSKEGGGSDRTSSDDESDESDESVSSDSDPRRRGRHAVVGARAALAIRALVRAEVSAEAARRRHREEHPEDASPEDRDARASVAPAEDTEEVVASRRSKRARPGSSAPR